MRRPVRSITARPVLLLLCLLLSACEKPRSLPRQSSKLNVVCTTTMIADLARQIAGDRALVQGVMKPGEDPHVYDIRPRDAQLIADADLVFANGLHLEATLDHIIYNHPATVVYLADDPRIQPLTSEAAAGAPDPHCWFNVQYFRVYAQRATTALVKADPANATAYRANSDRYLRELDELHTYVTRQIATIPRHRRVMVTSHDAFQYFGRAYDIDVLAVIGISTEQQPRPQDVELMEILVKDRNVRALFIETSVSKTLNDLVAKTAAATGVSIGGTLYSDSLGQPDTPAGTYLGMVRHNVDTIVKALQ